MNCISFLAALMLFSSIGSAAETSINKDCSRKIVKYQTSIQGSANAILGNFAILENSGDEIDANSQQLMADARSLIDAVNGLRESRQLGFRQTKILSRVCQQNTFNSDSVSLTLESLDQ